MIPQQQQPDNTMLLDMVGGTNFGRYPYQSLEQSWNLLKSGEFMIPYAGYESIYSIDSEGYGRGIFSSVRENLMIVVIDDVVYKVTIDSDGNLFVLSVGLLLTFLGDVYIAENNGGQILICDGSSIYLYNSVAGGFAQVHVPFEVSHITFQDTYFWAAVKGTNQARYSDNNDGRNWPTENTILLQSKPDNVQAVARFPGRGGLLFLFGETIVESWYDTGGTGVAYTRSNATTIDYGVLSVATIAWNESILCWLAGNEQSGPVIMVSSGSDAKPLSNDGLNYKLAQLQYPEQSYGFLFRQDGKLLYHIAFTNEIDNCSYVYDFSEGIFTTVSDENQNCHIAKRVCFFNNTYYFVSINDGNLYEMGSQFTNYNGEIIPRIRICSPKTKPDSSRFSINNMGFPIEQGVNTDLTTIDLTISKNDGLSFGGPDRKFLNKYGNGIGKLTWWQLGSANYFVPQFRFTTAGRVVFGNGIINTG